MMNKLKSWVEKVMPMTFGSFVLFAIVVYLMVIVGKTVWENYQSNKDIAAEQLKLQELEDHLAYTENEIAYFKTSSFREKQARAKLGYLDQGEKVISLPTAEPAPGDKKEVQEPVEVKVPNYYLWFNYFF